jgi:hypothetical protein
MHLHLHCTCTCTCTAPAPHCTCTGHHSQRQPSIDPHSLLMPLDRASKSQRIRVVEPPTLRTDVLRPCNSLFAF